MSLADIFSIPFLICLTVCILLIGCSSIFFYQKLTLQDHKISSMIEVISSMAEELRQTNILHNQVIGGASACPRVPNLIHVSDDDDDDTTEVESETSESDSENDSSCSDESSSNTSVDETEDTNKHIMVNLSMSDLNDIENEIIEIQELQENQHNHDMDLEDDEDDSDIEELEEMEDIGQKMEDNSQIDDVSQMESQIKTIHLEEPSEEVVDFSIFKSINISSDETHLEKPDYKKMTITKLREIAFQKGFADSAKLKKPEILKLLGVE